MIEVRFCARNFAGIVVLCLGVAACLTPRAPGAARVDALPANSSTQVAGSTVDGGTSRLLAAGNCNPSLPIVSLTYDDSLPTQLSTVAPALKAHHLRATFFLTDVRSDKTRWAELKSDGHELAAHTFNHPCPRAMSWVQRGNASEDYDQKRMAMELDANIDELRELGQIAPFSFAYPCGVKWLGEAHESYEALIKARFAGARGAVPDVITTLRDGFDVPATFLSGSGSQLVQAAQQAQLQNGWVVFGFHGVGGDSNPVSADAHEALLAFLEQAARGIQVLPFGEALACKSAH